MDFRKGFHTAFPQAIKYYHQPTGRYTSMRFNDMYEAWVKASLAAMPEAQIERCKTHTGTRWVNLAQHPMLRMSEPTEHAAQARAIAEGFRLPKPVKEEQYVG